MVACSGTSDAWIGNTSSTLGGSTWEFRGVEVLKAILTEGVSGSPTEIILAGTSAGSIGASAHVGTVQSLFPGANVLLVLDSTPPQFDLSRAVVNTAHGMALANLDNVSAVFNLIEVRWGSPLPSAAASVSAVWDQAVRIPCAFSTQCMLEDNYIPTNVSTFVISPASDAWTISTSGIDWVISGIENGEGPTILNLRDRFYVMLQSLRVSFQTGMNERSRDFPVGLFAPGCIHHGLLQPTSPHMPGSGPSAFDETTRNATVRVNTGTEDIDFVLRLDVTELYSSAGRSWTDLVVGGSNLEDALSAWVAAVRAGDRSPKVFADGCMGPSCNPTCLENMSFESADHYKTSADGWVIATLTISVVFLCTSLSMKVKAYLNPFEDKTYELIGVKVPEAAQMLVDTNDVRVRRGGRDYSDPAGISMEGSTKPGKDAAAVPGESSDDDADATTAESEIPAMHTMQPDDIGMSEKIKKMAHIWAKHSVLKLAAQQKHVAGNHPIASPRSTPAFVPDPDAQARRAALAHVFAAQHDNVMAQSSHSHWLSDPDGALKYDAEDTGHLRVRNMSYVVPGVEKDGTKVEKVLQSGVYSHCRPGVTAIMGPSGAGKTTFLNVAAGKIVGGELSGDVYFDKLPVYATKGGRRKAQQMTGFVTQLGTPWEESLSFRENLQYAAELRIPGGTPADRALRVETVIAAVEGRQFGNVVTAGLSGGQKRKLSMAIQLLSDSTRFLFLDEPTSGLDSTSTLSLLTLLKCLGRNGYTVLITIHQPRIEVWELFDEVLILATGRVCYQGPPDAAVAFLSHVAQEANGGAFERPEGSNPADIVIDHLAEPTNQQTVSAAYAATGVVRESRKEIDEHCLALIKTQKGRQTARQSLVEGARHAVVGFDRINVMDSLHRIYTMHRRLAHAKGLWLPSLLIHLMANIITLLYWNPGPTMKGLAIFLLFMSPLSICQGVVHGPIVARAKLVKIEAQEGICSVQEYTTAVSIYVGAIAAVQEIFIMGPSYFIAFQDREHDAEQGARVFLTLLAVMTLLAWLWTQISLTVAFSPVPVTIQLSLLNALFGAAGLMSGVMITKAQLQTSMGVWIADINPVHHAIAIAYVALFGDSAAKCEYTSSFFNCGVLNPVTENPEALLLGFGMRSTDPDQSFAVIYLYWFGASAAAMLMARRCQRRLLGQPPKWRDDSHAIDTTDLTALIEMQQELKQLKQQLQGESHSCSPLARYGSTDQTALIGMQQELKQFKQQLQGDSPSCSPPSRYCSDDLRPRASGAGESEAIGISTWKPAGCKHNRGSTVASATSGDGESSGSGSVV